MGQYQSISYKIAGTHIKLSNTHIFSRKTITLNYKWVSANVAEENNPKYDGINDRNVR